MDDELLSQARHAAEAVRRAEQLRAEALDARRRLCVRLHRSGLTTRQLAEIFDVTAPRISKIMDNNSEPRSQRFPKQRAPYDVPVEL